jgi:tripartite-type tricarboxylate transporter receptor subunit TctC
MRVAARIRENVMRRWRSCLVWAIPIAVLAVAAGAHAADPDKPVELVTPFPPGGPTDALGRQPAQALARDAKIIKDAGIKAE